MCAFVGALTSPTHITTNKASQVNMNGMLIDNIVRPQEIQRRFPDGLPLLDPVEDMGIKDENLKKVVEVSSKGLNLCL